MGNDDLTEKILDGRGDEYKELVYTIQVRDTSITFDELYKKLKKFLNFEVSHQGVKSEPAHFPAWLHLPILQNHTKTGWRSSSNYNNRNTGCCPCPLTRIAPPHQTMRS